MGSGELRCVFLLRLRVVRAKQSSGVIAYQDPAYLDKGWGHAPTACVLLGVSGALSLEKTATHGLPLVSSPYTSTGGSVCVRVCVWVCMCVLVCVCMCVCVCVCIHPLRADTEGLHQRRLSLLEDGGGGGGRGGG